ncbi:MAG: alpha/beta hydrolase [Alphaproteobacteria bacterium]|nr:alpha/beta hydrolase [Alphaproteobacteria bacterium]
MTLIATPKNPIPLGAQTGYLEIGKKLRLRYASWQSALKERRGTVCIFPGRNEFIEKYFEVVSELRRRGFAVAVLDWRGQGGSSRLTRNPIKGHVRNFDDYEEDLTHFMKGVVLPDCPTPYFALGHSMAATILFRAATKRGGWFSRMVLTAPMVEILNLPFSQERCGQIAEGLKLCGFGKQAVFTRRKDLWLSREFEGNLLTSDRERFFRNLGVLDAAPELSIGPPTFGWMNAALAASTEVRSDAFAPRVRIPSLMLAAGDDEIVSSKAIESLSSRLRAGTQLVLRGSRHEIMQERDSIREQFWAAFDAYIPGAAALSIAS